MIQEGVVVLTQEAEALEEALVLDPRITLEVEVVVQDGRQGIGFVAGLDAMNIILQAAWSAFGAKLQESQVQLFEIKKA